MFEQTDVFFGGREGYHTYRLPVIVISEKGTIFLFCDGRKYSPSDIGKIDPVLKRSLDGGRTWESLQVLQTDPGERTKIGNGCAIADCDTGDVYFIFCWNLTRAFCLTTSDEGETFHKSEITATFEQFQYPWQYFATGHVHGIQLQDGRLIAPVFLNDVPRSQENKGNMRVGVIYSDDHGETWRAGGMVPPKFEKLNESTPFETSNETLCINMRAMHRGYRVVAWSSDRGLTWSEPKLDKNLPCPTCQASTLTLPSKQSALTDTLEKNRVLFSNPASQKSRTNMTVRLSYDDGKTWAVSKQINPGPSGYSDMAVYDNGTIYLAYENGEKRYNEKITVVRFNLEWLTDGKDSLSNR